ncbi:Ig-like domain-containing protein [Pseudoalteromonas sp. MMG024]|uniref:Ig-like domain-containing protein n=1 Tax=Pseudoalteromonas sp. MMG024 TaxID=2909980 RepID=UPI001F387B5B|nr:Ig-like domain-containing protein [Pseudoalteromonas sp. MMG024]MCF6456203.1 Ig-like domain-containing protein [Pseudoalteromonas sp. MMG024]
MAQLIRFSFIMFFISLYGCGGGGSLEGNNPDPVDPITLEAVISNQTVNAVDGATVTVTVMQNGKGVANTLVTFAIDNNGQDGSLVEFKSDNPEATTDSNGVATIRIKAGNVAGSGQIKASIESGQSSSVNFTSTGEGGVTLSLSLTNSTIDATDGAELTVTVKEDGLPAGNKLVSFAIDDNDLEGDLVRFTNDSATASTNAEGIATIGVIAAELSGDGQIIATVASGESNSIVFSSTGGGGETDGPSVATIGLFTTTQQLSSSGIQGITLTALVKDANNNLVNGADVLFSSDSGELRVTKSTTGEDGKATAILNTETDPSNRTISVTASSSKINDVLDINVVGTNINISGTSSLALNDQSDFIIKLANSDGGVIANQIINLEVKDASKNNISIPESVQTDASGQAFVPVTGLAGGENAFIASALGATSEKAVIVQADSFLYTAFNNGNGTIVNPATNPIPDVLLSDVAEITLTWLRSGQPVKDGTVVNFTTTRGTFVNANGEPVEPVGETENGVVKARLKSDFAGKSLVRFNGVDGDITLDNQIEFEFVAETASRIVAQASPASIGPNGETSIISVVVKDPNGNLVKNKDVNFELTNDNTSGVLSPAKVTTDSNGSATSTYTSNAVSAIDGVEITTSINEGSSIVDDTVYLTVADRELFISLGTGNDVLENDVTSYNKQYTVFVVDADSTPRPNVTLTLSAVPSAFSKGYYERYYEEGSFKRWVPVYVQSGCPNEDLNRDGINDPGEDLNNNGSLTPGNVVNLIDGNVTTDENGQAIINILYPKDHANWVDIDLIAKAKVNGTESVKHVKFALPVSAEDVVDEEVAPPGSNSPFGVASGCDNIN